MRILPLLLLVLAVHLGESAASPSLSLAATRHLEKYMLQAYQERGLRGIEIYFSDNFRIYYYDGQVFNKAQFFELLARETYRAVFNSIRETYFENGDLIVSYYFGQVQYDARLKPIHTLLGGYEFVEIRPSSY